MEDSKKIEGLLSGFGTIIGAIPTRYVAEKTGVVYEKVVICFVDDEYKTKEGAVGSLGIRIKINKETFSKAFKDLNSAIGKRVYIGLDSYSKINHIIVDPK